MQPYLTNNSSNAQGRWDKYKSIVDKNHSNNPPNNSGDVNKEPDSLFSGQAKVSPLNDNKLIKQLNPKARDFVPDAGSANNTMNIRFCYSMRIYHPDLANLLDKIEYISNICKREIFIIRKNYENNNDLPTLASLSSLVVKTIETLPHNPSSINNAQNLINMLEKVYKKINVLTYLVKPGAAKVYYAMLNLYYILKIDMADYFTKVIQNLTIQNMPFAKEYKEELNRLIMQNNPNMHKSLVKFFSDNPGHDDVKALFNIPNNNSSITSGISLSSTVVDDDKTNDLESKCATEKKSTQTLTADYMIEVNDNINKNKPKLRINKNSPILDSIREEDYNLVSEHDDSEKMETVEQESDMYGINAYKLEVLPLRKCTDVSTAEITVYSMIERVFEGALCSWEPIRELIRLLFSNAKNKPSNKLIVALFEHILSEYREKVKLDTYLVSALELCAGLGARKYAQILLDMLAKDKAVDEKLRYRIDQALVKLCLSTEDLQWAKELYKNRLISGMMINSVRNNTVNNQDGKHDYHYIISSLLELCVAKNDFWFGYKELYELWK